MKDESNLFLLSFYSFRITFLPPLHFRCYSPSCHSIFYSIPFKIFIKSSFSLFIMFSYSLLLSFFFYHCLCPVLFNYFSHRSLQTFLFHSFEILFSCDISSLFLFPLLILCFLFLKVAISLFFFLYSIVLKHAAILIERFCKPCVTKEQNEMLIPMNHPFARPLLHRAVPCTNRP